MFKIVETTERGSQKLTIVPCQQEKNELSWPKFKTDKCIKLGDPQIPDDPSPKIIGLGCHVN